MIKLENVTVAFGGTLALDSVTLTIEPGINGLFGPNGSGKSTLLRVLAGLLKPRAGRIQWDWTTAPIDDESARGRIGFAGHETGLYPRLSLEENLRLFAQLYGVDGTQSTVMLEELGLVDHAGVRVGELPAGYKRRAAVARALLHRPSVLLLDEPFANVDDDAAELVIAAIKGWAGGDRDRIAVVATHGAKRVKPYADASIVLRRGRLAAHRILREEDS